jgi:hypothetical protein
MELNISQVSTQAAAQASALASLLLLRKTLELQAASIGGLVEAAAPVSAPSNPPNLGNSVDVMI